MAKTASDLATAVLKELRIIRRSAASPSAADAQTVLDKYDSVHLELKDRDKVFWEANAIPDRVFAALTKVMAGECAGTFGVEYDPANSYQRLLILAADDGTGQPTRATYF